MNPLNKPMCLFLRNVIYLLLISANVFGTNLDSLLKVSKSQYADSKGSTYLEIAEYYISSYDFSLSKEYANKAKSLLLKDMLKEWGVLYLIEGQIAYFKSENDSAIVLFNKAVPLLEKANANIYLRKTYNFLANSYFNVGDYGTAMEKFNNSIIVARKIGYARGEGAGLIGIGNIHMSTNNYKLALENYQKALEIFQADNYKKGIASSFNNIGQVYTNMENRSSAYYTYLKALKINREIENKVGEAEVLNSLGYIFADTSFKNFMPDTDLNVSLDSAIFFFNESIKVSEQIGNKKNLAKAYINWGYALVIISNNYSDALDKFEKAHEITVEINDKYEMAHTLQGFGMTYHKIGNFHKSISYYKKSIAIAEENDYLNILISVYRKVHSLYVEQGLYKNALHYLELYTKISDKVNEQKQQNFAVVFSLKEKEEDLRKKQVELLQKEVEAERNRKITYWIVTGLIIILIFAVLMLIQFIQKKKANKLLTEKNHKIVIQKEEILQQKEEIETQSNQVMEQKNLIEEQQKGIVDSIQYAKRIQDALLPQSDTIQTLFEQYFVLYRPRDIVSGDFYWIGRKKNTKIVVAADCTGHGVPGAFMSMLGTAFLNEIVADVNDLKAHEILNKLRAYVISSLKQTGKEGEQKDGVDLALYILEDGKNEIQFAGANNPLLIIREKKDEIMTEHSKISTEIMCNETSGKDYYVIQIKGDKMPIGIHSNTRSFETVTMPLCEGDNLYTYSDGYVDQFGGPKGKKYLNKRFKKFLVHIQDKPMAIQKILLETELYQWKKGGEQIDDILVVGVRI